MLIPLALSGQQERKYIRKGNRLYEKQKYSGSETQYHRAEGIDKQIPDATFNVADALYKQGKYSEAAEKFVAAEDSYDEPQMKADAYYNLGNSLLKDNKFKESIDAYIKSLLIDPDNIEAKYNLAYARDQLKKQQEQEQQKQNQDKKDQQDQDKKDQQDQDKKDQQDKQKQDQQDKKQDQNNENGQDQQNKNQGDDKNNKGQQEQNENRENEKPGQQQQGMSKQDAARLLDALSANEKEVQEKVNKNKMSQAKVRIEKNW